MGRIGPDRAIAVFFIQQLIKDLAVVHTGVCDTVAPDQLVFLVDVDVVVVTVVALAVLLGPACILIFLSLHVGYVVPAFRCLAFLNLLVLVPRTVVLQHIDQAGINDLATSRYQAGLLQFLVKTPKQFLDQTVTRQLLAEQPKRLGIEYRIFRRQLQEALERQPVPDLDFRLIVGQVLQRCSTSILNISVTSCGLRPALLLRCS